MTGPHPEGAAQEPSTRDKLIEATLACLRDHGHSDCTVKRIAEQAGVNHGLVHHYFGSKERLLAEALRRLDVHLMETIKPHAHRMRDQPGSLIREIIMPKVALNPDVFKVVLEFFAMSSRMPLVAQELRRFLAVRHETIGKMLGLKDHTAAALFFAGVFGLVMHYQVEPDLPLPEAAERLVRLILADNDAPSAPPHP